MSQFRKNLVSEKSLGFCFGKFGIGKKVSVSVSFKILVSSFSGGHCCADQDDWKGQEDSHDVLSVQFPVDIVLSLV